MELQQSVILISHFDFDFLVISHFDFDFLAMISLFGLSFCYSFYGYLLAQNGVVFCLKKKKELPSHPYLKHKLIYGTF